MCSEIRRHKNGTEWRNFYGRFKGKSLSATQAEALVTEFENYSLENISWEENPQRNKIKLFEIFDAKPVWLEIGFGGGEHLIHQAILNPDIGFIGCEPYQNGVAKLMGKLSVNPRQNIKCMMEMYETSLMYCPKILSRKFFFYTQIRGLKKSTIAGGL